MRKAMIALSIGSILTACEKELVEVSSNYFPMAQNTAWHYTNHYFSTLDASPWGTDTSLYKIEKDTVVAGKRYALLTDSEGFLKRGFRKDGHHYYFRDFRYFDTGKEYLFLKDDQPVGSSWEETSSNGVFKRVYTIEDKLAEKTINGTAYRDVMEVKEEVFLKDGDTFTWNYQINHSYAKNIGEIYVYYPYPSFKIYGDQITTLLDFE